MGLMLFAMLFLFVDQLLISTAQTTDAGHFPYSFMTRDAEKATARRYDYIVVGGGAAGCPLAATLSQKYSVLLLERGESPYGNPNIENGTAFRKAYNETNNTTSIVQRFVTDDLVQLARARVLGGRTAINDGHYSRASVEYIQRMGWNESLVNMSYEWVEKDIVFGPNPLTRWSSAFQAALVQAGIKPSNGYTLDHVEGIKISGSTFDKNGKRHTAADLLKHANPDNIVVLLHATVGRILFNSSSGRIKARGVEFINQDGRSYEAFVNESSCCSELILSAGSIGSPQILLLSGVGPSKNLEQMNISVVRDLTYVGRGIQDSPRATLTLQSPIALDNSGTQVVAIIDDSQVYIEASSSTDYRNSSRGPLRLYYGIISVRVAYPESRGDLWLRSTDPRDNPSLRYNYYTLPLDQQKCVLGVKTMANISKTQSIKGFEFHDGAGDGLRFVGEALPGPDPNNPHGDEALIRFCSDTLKTYSLWQHDDFHGGCHHNNVIDATHRVRGVDGLRVVDASTFKDSPGTHPQATTMMLGRYSGLMILTERNGRV